MPRTALICARRSLNPLGLSVISAEISLAPFPENSPYIILYGCENQKYVIYFSMSVFPKIVLFFMVFSMLTFHQAKGETVMPKDMHWLGHDTFRITGEKVVYTDPFKLKKKDTADIILITHEHYDHCSPEDVKKIQGPGTAIVTVADCAKKLTGDITVVKPGDTVTVKGVVIEAVPSYNTNKQFHTRERGWVGFVFTLGGQRIYLAGDTDHIPEMKNIRADIALLPVSGTYVMTADEAVRAALDIKPKIAVPMHFGSIVGSMDDAQRFADGLKGKVTVEILPEE